MPFVKRSFFVLCFFLVLVNAKAQQMAHFSQYFAIPEIYNPATITADYKFNAVGLFRQQWVGVENAPQFLFFAVSAPFQLFLIYYNFFRLGCKQTDKIIADFRLSLHQKNGHCEPVRTLAWQSPGFSGLFRWFSLLTLPPTAHPGDASAFAMLASRYAVDSSDEEDGDLEEFGLFEQVDEFVEACVGEFLNLQNGLFAVNMSNSRNIELDLTPQEARVDAAIGLTNGLSVGLQFSFGRIEFIVCRK